LVQGKTLCCWHLHISFIAFCMKLRMASSSLHRGRDARRARDPDSRAVFSAVEEK
jgi:hypothetical protein